MLGLFVPGGVIFRDARYFALNGEASHPKQVLLDLIYKMKQAHTGKKQARAHRLAQTHTDSHGLTRIHLCTDAHRHNSFRTAQALTSTWSLLQPLSLARCLRPTPQEIKVSLCCYPPLPQIQSCGWLAALLGILISGDMSRPTLIRGPGGSSA